MRSWVSALAIVVLAAPARAQLVSIEPSTLPLSGAERGQLEKFVRAGEWLHAEASLHRHVLARPDSAELRKALAAAHFRNERYFAAAAEYTRAARSERLDPASRFTLATAYIAIDRRHWARRELEALVEEYPRNALFRHWLAGIYQHYQWFDRAIEETKKAIDLDPAWPAARDRLGQCYEALGHSDEALEAYTNADELARKRSDASPWPSYHRGSLLRQIGKFEEALASLEWTTALDPKLAEARYELGMTLDRLNRPIDALKALKEAVRLDPGNPKFHYALSRLQSRTGDAEGARVSLEKFQQLSRRQPPR